MRLLKKVRAEGGMMKFRKKPTEIEATQWWKNGDHPDDNCKMIDAGEGPFLSEGKIVRYFRHPGVDGKSRCDKCGNIFHLHGFIDTSEGMGQMHTVCPGDFIITGIWGERYPCKPNIFEATYEKVEP